MRKKDNKHLLDQIHHLTAIGIPANHIGRLIGCSQTHVYNLVKEHHKIPYREFKKNMILETRMKQFNE